MYLSTPKTETDINIQISGGLDRRLERLVNKQFIDFREHSKHVTLKTNIPGKTVKAISKFVGHCLMKMLLNTSHGRQTVAEKDMLRKDKWRFLTTEKKKNSTRVSGKSDIFFFKLFVYRLEAPLRELTVMSKAAVAKAVKSTRRERGN